MYYNLLSAKGDGFMSFGEVEYSLSDLGIVAVTGQNKFEPKADSNGSGKSALFELVLYTLTGSTSRGSSEVANTILNKGVWTEIEMQVDDNHYVISRSKNHELYGSGIKIVKNGEDISGNTLTKSKEILTDELGQLDYDTLTSIIILSQGLPGRLSSLKPSSRKSRLEELSKTDHYVDDLQSKISNTIKVLSVRQSDLSGELIKCDSSINNAKFTISTNQSKIDAIKEKAGSLISKEEFEEMQSLLTSTKQEVDTLNRRVYDLNTAITNNNFKMRELNSQLESKKFENQRLLQQYQNVDSSVCPTCGNSITNLARQEELRASTLSQIQELKASMANILAELPTLEEANKVLNSKLISAQEEVDSAVQEMNLYQDKVNEYKSYSSSTNLLEEAIQTAEATIKECESKKEELAEKMADIVQQVEIANFYKNHLSRKFRSFLLGGVIKYMNLKAQEYSPYLFEKQGNVSLEADGNNINIYLGNRRFEDLSGGEGRRVDIVLQLIQRDLARNESGLSSNLLVLDEILDYLDSAGVDSVLRLLEYKSPDIDTMMVVSHKKDIKIPSDTTFLVIKEENQISRIREGHGR